MSAEDPYSEMICTDNGEPKDIQEMGDTHTQTHSGLGKMSPRSLTDRPWQQWPAQF